MALVEWLRGLNMDTAGELVRASGPLVAGIAFGSGWMVWLDAVLCSKDNTAFVFYLPGIGATLTLFMINAVRRARCSLNPLWKDSARACPGPAPLLLRLDEPPRRAEAPHRPARAACPPSAQEDLSSPDPFDDSTGRRRAWLFLSYLCSFGAVGGAIAALAVHFSKHDRDLYTGVAGVVQTALILASALLYWVTRQNQSGGGLGYY